MRLLSRLYDEFMGRPARRRSIELAAKEAQAFADREAQRIELASEEAQAGDSDRSASA